MWYAMAVVIATIAVLSDALTISGTVSEPMLWSLFGVAISRIMTNRELRMVQKQVSIPTQGNAILRKEMQSFENDGQALQSDVVTFIKKNENKES